VDGNLFLAIVSAIVPFGVAALMALFPDWRWLGWLVVAACLGVVAWATSSYLTGKNPTLAVRYFSLLAGVAGALFVASAAFLFDRAAFPLSSAIVAADAALVRIQFFGTDQLPTEVRRENIADWFAYYAPSVRATYKSTEDGKDKVFAAIPKTWAIFVVFDKPTIYREVTVGFSAPGLPIYDVMQRTQRSVIASFRSDIPAGTLEIATK